MPPSEAECHDALLGAAEILGHPPSKREYEVFDIGPSTTTHHRFCGGWNEAKRQVGLEIFPCRWTDTYTLAEIHGNP